MLLPFDVRADPVGWTVVDVATDRAAVLDGLTLSGLQLEDAESLVFSMNTFERQLEEAARRRVTEDLGVPLAGIGCHRAEGP
jgi:hypothetical protein